jgi:glycosyltransferase involved in cell wall biosynthesis
MAPVKNPHLLLKVALQLPDLQFVMAGGGNLLEEIKSIAPANVKVIGWTDASIFLSAIDVVISTSDNEGIPIALIEAQLSGKPVIATNVGSNCEVVLDEVTGILTKSTVDSLVAAIVRFEASPTARMEMGGRAEKISKEKFTLEAMIETHAKLYDKF